MTAWNATAVPATAPSLGGPFDDIDFVVVDVETTGWSPEDAGITEIAAVRMRGGEVRGQFSALVNPGGAIPEQICALTGITDAMVAAAPPVSRVLPVFLAFASGGVLTAHNAPFDVAFLAAACQDCGLRWPDFTVLDTVALARRLVTAEEAADCKLATLAALFGARVRPRHRALADVLATADVLSGLLARLARTGARTLAAIDSLPEIRAERDQRQNEAEPVPGSAR